MTGTILPAERAVTFYTSSSLPVLVIQINLYRTFTCIEYSYVAVLLLLLKYMIWILSPVNGLKQVLLIHDNTMCLFYRRNTLERNSKLCHLSYKTI